MIRWFTQNGVAANLLAGITIVTGIFAAMNIKLELFPELESCLVLHQGQLVWSEIEPGVTRLLGELSVIRRTDGKEGWGTNHHNHTDLVIHYPNRNCKHTHLSENVN